MRIERADVIRRLLLEHESGQAFSEKGTQQNSLTAITRGEIDVAPLRGPAHYGRAIAAHGSQTSAGSHDFRFGEQGSHDLKRLQDGGYAFGRDFAVEPGPFLGGPGQHGTVGLGKHVIPAMENGVAKNSPGFQDDDLSAQRLNRQ